MYPPREKMEKVPGSAQGQAKTRPLASIETVMPVMTNRQAVRAEHAWREEIRAPEQRPSAWAEGLFEHWQEREAAEKNRATHVSRL